MGTGEYETKAVSDEIHFSVSATVKVRNYFATQHLWSAQRFARLCRDRENEILMWNNVDIQHRSYVISAVLSSVAFLEAYVNEVFQDVVDTMPGQTNPRTEGISADSATLMREFSRKKGAVPVERSLSVLHKYQLALLCARADKLEPGHDEFQNADFLVALRNHLVHYMPKTEDLEVVHKFEADLKGRFPENRQEIGSPWFPNKCLGAGCAEWAWRSSVVLADESSRTSSGLQVGPHGFPRAMALGT